jgi:alkanesulfonate monooxygenase SsuD/methylene tetrahydromethanopterin reductase-like flavin-dependent oxidoreductase (luciferase family)
VLDVGSCALTEEVKEETMVGTPEMVRERLQPMIDAGIDYFIVTIPREAYDQEPVRHFAREVIPMFD